MIRYFLVTTVRMGTPIAITSTGACFAQRTGVNNIGLEGAMAMGAFAAVAGSYLSNNPWVGVLFAMFIGAAISLIHGFVTITCGGNMAVSSQAIILLSTGLTAMGTKTVFGNVGFTSQVTSLTKTPFLGRLPFIGSILSNYSPLVYMAFVFLGLFWYLLYKTPIGLHMQACGEYPRAADTAGVQVNLLRYIGVGISGMFGGLGGAILSIGSMNMYQDGMIAGRGFLALGAVVLGRHSLAGAFVAGIIFGFFDTLQLYVQAIPHFPIPSQLIQTIPYLASLIILIIGTGKKGGAKAPMALGQAYSAASGSK